MTVLSMCLATTPINCSPSMSTRKCLTPRLTCVHLRVCLRIAHRATCLPVCLPMLAQGNLEVLASHGDPKLVVHSIEEQYAKAKRFVERFRESFADKELKQIQVRPHTLTYMFCTGLQALANPIGDRYCRLLFRARSMHVSMYYASGIPLRVLQDWIRALEGGNEEDAAVPPSQPTSNGGTAAPLQRPPFPPSLPSSRNLQQQQFRFLSKDEQIAVSATCHLRALRCSVPCWLELHLFTVSSGWRQVPSLIAFRYVRVP